jgi:DNA relaxase NicK
MISQDPSKPPANNMGAQHPQIPPDSSETDITVSAQIDWIQLSGTPDTCLKAQAWFNQHFTLNEPSPGGNRFYQHMRLHPLTGSTFSWMDHSDQDKWFLLVRGQGCQWLQDPISKLRPLLNLDTQCSRIDLAIDFHGPCSSIIQDIIESSEDDQIKPLMSRDTRAPMRGSELLGRSVYLGSQASRKYICVYDKGLETGSETEGKWIRWESRFRNEAAQAVREHLQVNDDPNHIRALAAGVLSEVDGPASVWHRLLSQAPLRISTPRANVTLEKTIHHISQQLGPILEAAQITGDDPYQIARVLGVLDNREMPRNHARTKKAQEIIAHLNDIDYYQIDET